ncbi:nitrile hydratase accessory protein [Mesorhizobium sp. ESP7-2]|uniref:nitrile hydratase accessory protein n=1 Tax=Mesorhizobium sp. ESP7-2 TaxID=2876622 RepID=UPI001CC9E182|nr:nitrile hydratase accessory protein [Mesorhizobium sp. ESP7-2]MBZ9709592.1 nitrile hydratase accessory protein [Mesorhizobium sp. ESP7-2]
MSRSEAKKGPAASLPTGLDAPVFAEPWQAEAFAMTVALHDKGLFSWGEWADALSAEVKKPGAAADGHDYYEHWLAALEGLLASKGLAAKPDVDAMAQAWERAAHATPHGKPILLENDPRAAS